ncbi:MAG: hypothetical protein CBD34_00295 [Rickettsiales bacterium TMED174]|mgnify:FL=1|nr:MAG: hypothetical protein CBD34_00295 [Rickettsiales bacterium TMED174]
MKTLLFIPARGGSEGIKNKNLTKIKNKPLLKYTIDLAKNFKKFDTFISTDSKKIIKYCRSLGVKIDYVRPKKFAKATSSMYDTVIDALRWLEMNNKFYENILILQPTNPLRTKNEVNKILKIFKKKKLISLASVTKMREHPFECVFFKNKKWKFLQKSKVPVVRRQDFKQKYFFIDGTYYLLNINFLKKNKKFISLKHTHFFKLNHKWPIDIDYKEDLKVARSFL